ncbi:Ninjurin-1 [Larimichthys crocea]|uniref:Uncharacterized protein n=1 Tax=Larimichthys crocea TaxID=215358 RepID=A0ACD3R938_LARCR|nr:Ninjurin-1 [Larimichthys crocea]
MDTDRRLHTGEDIALNKAGTDIEALTPSGKVHRPININHYATKKSAAQSMLDVALLMANSSQLKTCSLRGASLSFLHPPHCPAVCVHRVTGHSGTAARLYWQVTQTFAYFHIVIVSSPSFLHSESILLILGSLIWGAVKYDLNDVRKHRKLNTMNNVATVFVFFTVLVNIFITALGFEGHIRTVQSPVIAIPEPKLSPLPLDLNITGGI